MSNTVFVVNKKTGKIGKFPKHLLAQEDNLELYVEPVSVKSPTYKEMKEMAEDKGLSISGNIKKSELKELLEL